MERFELLVPPESEGERIDRFLAGCEELELSRSAVQQLLEQGCVRCQQAPAAKNIARPKSPVSSVKGVMRPIRGTPA